MDEKMKQELNYLQVRRVSKESNQREAGGKEIESLVENQVQMRPLNLTEGTDRKKSSRFNPLNKFARSNRCMGKNNKNRMRRGICSCRFSLKSVVCLCRILASDK
jgi:hypothetical protein